MNWEASLGRIEFDEVRTGHLAQSLTFHFMMIVMY
jgi:hypothetical protein